MITINVLNAGELYQLVLNAVAAFLKQDGFQGLLRLSALIGIVMATVGFLKSRDPLIYGKWFVTYMLMTNLIIIPKTTVEIYDISSQKSKIVDNVPVVFALSTSLITSIGLGLAQSFDALLQVLPLGPKGKPIPEELLYTQTGALFGARLIQASTSFRITDPILKEEMNQYFRNCVVGDIRLNQKYSVRDLSQSGNLWQLFTTHPSPLRMTEVNHKMVTCLEASKVDGEYSLHKKLNAEIKNAYSFFGVNLFGKPKNTSYELLFEKHLKSAFEYYQGLTDSASNLFLQNMMINAIHSSIANYQAYTDATAGIVNQEFSKSQAQQRWSWQLGGLKALWFLPLLHTWLTVLLFGLFPIIILLATLPSCTKVITYYKQFFLSLQLWPFLFAFLNAGMALYGSHQSGEYGQFTLVNVDKIDELHNDIAGAAGWIMMLIPFIANGIASNLSAAFSHLATSMTSHVQGSSMAVAGEVASGAFSLGQTSFYNTNANNFSANKHDSNWTHMHGMHMEQLGSGVLKTLNSSGEAIFDVSPGMTRGAVSVVNTKAINASLNQAQEESSQAVKNEASQYQSSLSGFAHRALQLSQLGGHEMRLGEGVSTSESGQYSKALATINHVAEDVAQRLGVSKEDALSHLTSGGWGAHIGVKSQGSIWGKLAQLGTGFHGGGDAHIKFEKSSLSSDKYHTGVDDALSARQAQDFNDAMNYVSNFLHNHHFDNTHSQAASLSNQLGADLRTAEVASHNIDASLSKAKRIQNAKNYMESNGEQITKNLDQVFPNYVASRVGKSERDELFAHPGDMNSLNKLQALGQDFISAKRDELIEKYGNQEGAAEIASYYQKEQNHVINKEQQLRRDYQKNSTELALQSQSLGLGIEMNKAHALEQEVGQKTNTLNQNLKHGKGMIENDRHDLIHEKDWKMHQGMVDAQKNLVIPENTHLPSWIESRKLHKKENKKWIRNN